MNGTPPPLRFERIRSFGRIFGDTRRFVQENFAVFFKTIIFLVGPIALLTCSLEQFYAVDINGYDGVPDWSHLGSYVASTVIFSQARAMINGLFTALVVSHFVKVYREKGQGKFDVNDVSKSIIKDFFGSGLTMIVLLLGVSFISVVLFYIIYGLAQVSLGAAIAIIFGGWLAYFLIRFPFWYFVFSVFIARTSNGVKNVFSGISLAGKVFSGNWWFTWVMMFCMYMILSLVGWCVSYPAGILASYAKLLSYNPEKMTDYKLIQSILLAFSEFGKTIINSVFLITVTLQFYSLKEKVDGEGTKKVVEMIGTKNDDEEIELTY